MAPKECRDRNISKNLSIDGKQFVRASRNGQRCHYHRSHTRSCHRVYLITFVTNHFCFQDGCFLCKLADVQNIIDFYFSSYKFNRKDAMGLAYSGRGFNDPNLFVAETTQPHVAPMSVRECTRKKPRRCEEFTKRMTYAIPLEIVYLTPLTVCH